MPEQAILPDRLSKLFRNSAAKARHLQSCYVLSVHEVCVILILLTARRTVSHALCMAGRVAHNRQGR